MSDIVGKLTLKQKIKVVHGNGAWHTNAIEGLLPSVMMTDGPHGLRKQSDANRGINDSVKSTCFPTACSVASSWNRRNAALVGEAIAREAIAENVDVVLGPGINIKRSPLCGRNFEYFSEDPYLAGELASSYVSAMQSNGVGCSVKHFAVNSQETRRMTVNAVVDERALREIYLSAFERVVKNAKPYTVMAAYNKVNGAPAAQNRKLLTDVLRNEWGFDGLVVSDWGACYDVAEAIEAGMDLEMPDGGDYHERRTEKAVESGKLSVAALDRACSNVAALVDKCRREKPSVPSDYLDRHDCIARQIAADSAVLLKNDGILPLDKNSEVLVVGELAEKPRYQGAGSSHVNSDCVSFLDVLAYYGVNYEYAKGYSVKGDCPVKKYEEEALELAKKYDTVLFFGGLTDDFEGEGYDRTKLNIPDCQTQLLSKLRGVNANIAFVAFGGSPFTMSWLGNVKALLHMYLGGQSVMKAAYDVLFGDVSPSGRLAETYPIRLEDTPCYNYFANNRYVDEHRESIFVGYRYYSTYGIPVLFPFGYGLSYTEFEYSNLKVTRKGNSYGVEVTVTNTGERDASEVVQIYVDNCDCGYIRAKRELRAFDKVFVKSGQSVTVSLDIDERAFCIYLDGKFVRVAGKYAVSVCKNVNDTLISCEIEADGSEVKGNDRENYPCYFEPVVGSFSIDEGQFYKLANQNKETYATPKRGEYTLRNTFEDMINDVGLVRTIMRFVRKMAKKQSPSKSYDDPVAKMIYKGSLETPLISIMSVGGIPSKYVMFICYHANKRKGKALKALRGKYDIE
ncbi:MAG: glycoside hydrolase family 3 C-terminal domain-containing protein [Corallococcus sp.]|nr:glycoside hydrolase family 3 C-terminal domain-containing protein [Corallococcus sp.]